MEGSSTCSGILMDYVMELFPFHHADLYSICRRKTALRTVLLSKVDPIIAPMSANFIDAMIKTARKVSRRKLSKEEKSCP